MIGKLTGKIDEIYEDSVILNVGGVGYQIFTPLNTLSELRSNHNNIFSLFIETHVREDHIHLYGFINLEIKSAFVLLKTVSGIGARVALAILSYLSPSEIQGALDMQDKNLFCTVPGVGPKLGERMLVELKGKKFSLSGSVYSASNTSSSNIVEEASTALSNLGIGKNEAVNMVKNILQNSPDLSIDQVIRTALQNRSKS